jgi:hypothetical protein
MNGLSRGLRGAVAGSIGTLAMDLLWYARDRREGGAGPCRDWEITRDVRDWSDAPAPGQMGRKMIETVTGRDVPVERAAALSNAMRWAVRPFVDGRLRGADRDAPPAAPVAWGRLRRGDLVLGLRHAAARRHLRADLEVRRPGRSTRTSARTCCSAPSPTEHSASSGCSRVRRA